MTTTIRNRLPATVATVTAALMLFTLTLFSAAAHADKGTAHADATPAAADTASPDKGGDKQAFTPSGTVNLNSASEEELMLLPGVGPSKAAAIVAWRSKHGSFKKLEDLTRVKGFGRKTLQKLRAALSLSGPTNYRGKKNPTGEPLAGRPPAEVTP